MSRTKHKNGTNKGLGLPLRYKDAELPENPLPAYFADTVMDLLLVNGVYRLTLAKRGANKEFSPAVRVFIPASKLIAVLQGVERASGEILSKLQARTDGRDLEGETMVQMPEKGDEPPVEAVAEGVGKSKGPLELGRKLMRKVAAKARIKKSPKKDSEKAAKSASEKAPKKAAPKKEPGGKSKKAQKAGSKKDSKKESKAARRTARMTARSKDRKKGR